MTTPKRILILSLALLLLTLPLLTACARQAPADITAGNNAKTDKSGSVEPKARPSGTLTFAAVSLGEESWHPTKMGGNTASFISPMVENMLYRDNSGNLAPGLAERWESSPDGLAYTYYLRKGIQFHDGLGEFTTDDVKFSYEIGSRKGTQNAYLSRLAEKVASIDIINPYQITFHTKQPMVDFFTGVADPLPWFLIFSKKYFDTVGEEKASLHPIGTGPYKFVEYKLGDYLKMEALDTHWRQVPFFKTLVMKVVSEEATRVAMLKAGEADVIELSLGFKKEVQAAGMKIKSLPNNAGIGISLGGMYFPGHKGYDSSVPWVGPDPEKALKVRKALNLAIDRNEVLDNLFMGEGQVGGVPPYFPGTTFWDPAWKPYSYDPNEAKKLLAEAGYPNGFEITMWLFPLSGRTELPNVGQAVAMYWQKNLGLKVNLVPTEYNTIRPSLGERKTAGKMWPYGYLWGSEPFTFLSVTAYTKASANVQGFEQTQVDQLLEKALTEVDVNKRADIGKQIGRLIYDNYWFVPIVTKNSVWGVGSKVGDWPVPAGATFGANWEYLAPAR